MAILSALITFAISTVVSIGLSVVQGALAKKRKVDVNSIDASQHVQRTLANRTPLSLVVGRRSVGGDGYYDDGHGIKNEYGISITVLSVRPITKFVGLRLDTNKAVLSGDPTTGQVEVENIHLGKNDANRIMVRVFKGDDNAALGTYLSNITGGAYSDSDNFGQMAVLVMSCRNTNDDIDKKTGKNYIPFQGYPQASVEVEGVKVCDPRIAGASYGDESTYVYSENPALIEAQLDYGFYDGAAGRKHLVVGNGYPSALLPVERIKSNADYCDARGYKCHGILRSGKNDDQKEIRACYNADRYELAGQLYSTPEGNRPVYGDLDLSQHPAAKVIGYNRSGDASHRYNQMQTFYVEPQELYSDKELPLHTSSDYLEQDGGIPRGTSFPLRFVTDKTQAGSLQQEEMALYRATETCEIVDLPMWRDVIDLGSVVTLKNTNNEDVNERDWVVIGKNRDHRNVSLSLKQFIGGYSFENPAPPSITINVPQDREWPFWETPDHVPANTVHQTLIATSWPKGLGLSGGVQNNIGRISITEHERIYADETVSISSNMLTGLLLNTRYSVYYDDADRVGGDVTYIATTDHNAAQTSEASPSRHFMGYVTTPSNVGASPTIGTPSIANNLVPLSVPNSDALGGVGAAEVLSSVETAKNDIADLVQTYGDTASSAVSAAAALGAQALIEDAKDEIEEIQEQVEADVLVIEDLASAVSADAQAASLSETAAAAVQTQVESTAAIVEEDRISAKAALSNAVHLGGDPYIVHPEQSWPSFYPDNFTDGVDAVDALGGTALIKEGGHLFGESGIKYYLDPAKTYSVKMTYKIDDLGTKGAKNVYLGVRSYDVNETAIGANFGTTYLDIKYSQPVSVGGYQTIEGVLGDLNGGEAFKVGMVYVRPFIIVGYAGDGKYLMGSFEINEITDLLLTQQAASASIDSVSAAAVQVTLAEAEATAAKNDRIATQTALGQAEIAQQNAVSAQENAQGFMNSAATSNSLSASNLAQSEQLAHQKGLSVNGAFGAGNYDQFGPQNNIAFLPDYQGEANVLRITGYKALYTPMVPIDPTRKYKIHCSIAAEGSTAAKFYAGAKAYDANGNQLVHIPGSIAYSVWNPSISINSTNGWEKTVGGVMTGEGTGTYLIFPVGTRFVSAGILMNYGLVSSEPTYLSELWIEDVTQQETVAVNTLISTQQAVIATEAAAAAEYSLGLLSNFSAGVNVLPNSTFLNIPINTTPNHPIVNWQFSSSPSSAGAFDYYVIDNSDNSKFGWQGATLPNERAVAMYQYGGNARVDEMSIDVSVEAGDIIFSSVYVGTVSCGVLIKILWLNSSGEMLSEAPFTTNAQATSSGPSGGKTLDDWTRIWVKGTTPASAVKAKLVIAKYGTVSGNSSIAFITRPMLEIGQDNQSEPSAYSIGILNGDLVAQVDINAGTIATNQGRLAAYLELVAAAGGNAAHIKMVADGSGSYLSLAASSLLLSASDGSNLREALKITFDKTTLSGNIEMGAKATIGNYGALIALQPFTVPVTDGYVFSFGETLNTIPNFDPDISQLPSLPAGDMYVVKILNSTPSGGQVSAKRVTTGAISSVMATGSTNGTSSQPDKVLNKPTALDSFQGNYLFSINLQVNPTEITGHGIWYWGGSLEFFVRPAGGAWTSLGSLSLGNNDDFDFTSTNQIVARNFGGVIGQDNANPEFGISLVPGAESQITGINSFTVQYQTQAASSEVSATPNGEQFDMKVSPQNA